MNTTCRAFAERGRDGSLDFSGDISGNVTLSLIQVPDSSGNGSAYVSATVEDFCTRQAKLDEYSIRAVVKVTCTWPDMPVGGGIRGEAEVLIVGDCPPGQEGEPDAKLVVKEAAVKEFQSMHVKN